MNTKDLISVIIPLYNETRFLKKALDSIFNQTYKKIEVIIVDSSVNQEVCEILSEYQNEYQDKIYVYKQEKNGVAAALNYGITKANGEFIARMDADDIACVNRFEKQIVFFHQHPEVNVLGSRTIVIDENDMQLYQSKVPEKQENIETNLIFENPMWHPTLMFRKSVFDSGYSYDIHNKTEDYDLWTRMIVGGVKFSNLLSPLMFYRQYGGNLSTLNLASNEVYAANSARKYLEKKLEISLDEFSHEHFFRVGLKRLISKRDASFLLDHFLLLYKIFTANNKRRIFSHESLIYELNKRWREYCSPYYESLLKCIKGYTLFLEEDIERNIIFLEYLASKYSIDMTNIIDMKQKMHSILNKNEELLNILLKSGKKIILYGYGQRGKRLYALIQKLKEQGLINWNVLGISDKCNIDNDYYINPENILEQDFDLILVTSNKYFYEIKNELLVKGYPEKCIIDSLFLDNLEAFLHE